MINLFFFFAIKENKLVEDICKIIFNKYIEMYVESFSYTIRNMILSIHNYGNINQIKLSDEDMYSQLTDINFQNNFNLDSYQEEK